MSGETRGRRSRFVRRAVSISAFFVACIVSLAPSATAAAPQAHGYWWRLENGGANLPAPPNVPARGLWVSNDGAGQHAISAVRYRSASGIEIEELVLTIADERGPAPVLLACSARSSWSSVDAGAWDDRPASSCDVAFSRGDRRGDRIHFDLRGLARSGELDVVVLAPPDLGSAFSIAFQAPGPEAIVTRAPGQSPSASPSPSRRAAPRTPSLASSVLTTRQTTPSATPSVSDPTQQPAASSPLREAVRDLAGEGRDGNSNAFLWLLGGVAVIIAIAGWRVRPNRRPRNDPSAT